ncbi:methyltransferase type 11 [Lamprobacter modestohalophilus]|uniref:Methyltransferase type 11 n=1 Tax=Lamprobacter modestohalophilus TaxID=1064514 RepID=A0A9X1B5K8_9GAMM|nr:class I SAM-dependent methyltransferase [Lamprobacter modestohalophilus]MBK1619742.1 methyltransferase type 11 [Lamprobacter modestohalophilus]
MRLNDPDAYQTATDIALLAELLDLRGARVLELGCGAAVATRALVEQLGAAEVVATEVDATQLAKNCAITDLPQVRFVVGGAEAIGAPDASFDAVLMFKSLHHVPVAQLDTALAEIHRVLKPGCPACFIEPVYWGEFNALMAMVHEERAEREAAFAALERAVASGRFVLEAQRFVQIPGTIADWDAFAERYLQVSYRPDPIEAERVARIRAAFEQHLTPTGAHFLKPHRIDLLRRQPGLV